MYACVLLLAYIYTCVCVCIEICVYIYPFSHVNKRKASRLKRSNTYCALWTIEVGKIEIQYLFDGLECLLSSKLSLYAFWQQSLLIETEKREREKRKRGCSFSLVHSFMLSEFPVVHPPSVSCRTHALDVDCYSNHSRRLMIFFSSRFSPLFPFAFCLFRLPMLYVCQH